jgi:adenylate kinase family enzyme
MNLGKRICILGGSNSGKSTLAKRLGDKLDCPVLYMDKIAHIPGSNWVRDSIEETGRKHDEFITQPSWIVEGTYGRYLKQRLEAADTVIIMKAGKLKRLWRYLVRAWHGNKDRPGRLDGALKEFSWSMLWWILVKENKNKKYYALPAGYPHLKIITLRSFKDAEKLLAILPST